nr:LppA family lipoprotein [Rhodococcus sp. HNM0569]
MTGCGDVTKNPYEATGEQDTAAAAQRLTELPTLEATEAHAQRVAEELGAYITSLAPHLQWEWMDSRSQSGCHRPYDQTDGKLVAIPNYVAKGSIPDSIWPQALQRARELASELGATEVETFHNEPGNRDVRFYSKEGTAIRFGDMGNTLIGIDTGCRLPEAVANSAPPPPPTS